MIPSDPFVYADTDPIIYKAPTNPGAVEIEQTMYSRVDDKTMSDMYDAYLRAFGYLKHRGYDIPSKPVAPDFNFDYTRCCNTPIPPPVIAYARHKSLAELDPRTDIIPFDEYVEQEIRMHQQKFFVALGRGNSKSCTSQLNALDILYHNNVITLNEYRGYAKDLLNRLYGTDCLKNEKENTTMNGTMNESQIERKPVVAYNEDRDVVVILGHLCDLDSCMIDRTNHMKEIRIKAYQNAELNNHQKAILDCLGSGEFKKPVKSTSKGPDIDPFAIKRVIFNEPATIVFWADGTKTVVKCDPKTDIYDPEKGLAMCFARKALGNKMDYYNTLRRHLKKVMKPKPEETVTEFKV